MPWFPEIPKSRNPVKTELFAQYGDDSALYVSNNTDYIINAWQKTTSKY